ncbi:indolepyruvate ferredoxin oxidoreductase family protein [Candidatus Kaiserbacteria bacterium]|nr:indolepyruvate ferredoxin oxidoreductase family protein [Candidatus Kaiserbacteria bacterium]
MSEKLPLLNWPSVPETATYMYLTGMQSLALPLLVQRKRDERAGLNTAGGAWGYTGSPLGGLNVSLAEAARVGAPHVQSFMAVNENLAANIAWGSQQSKEFGGTPYHGIFSAWYGKGPGFYQSMDAFMHACAAGVSPHGGALALIGNDPGNESSTIPHQSGYALMQVGMPYLEPSTPQQMFDFMMLGWAMSRHSGSWVGINLVSNICDASARIFVDPCFKIVVPKIVDLYDLHLSLKDKPLELEAKMVHRLKRIEAFAHTNHLNMLTHDTDHLRLVIMGVGRMYTEVMEALRLLGIDEHARQKLGIAVVCIDMPYPLSFDSPTMRRLLNASCVLVVEEKADIVEGQLKKMFYDARPTSPRIFGKNIPGGGALPSIGVLSVAQIADAIVKACAQCGSRDEDLDRRLKEIISQDAVAHAQQFIEVQRTPHFCPGCPHPKSTHVAEGKKAYAGIGCHYMKALPQDSQTVGVTQMGGEMVPILGWMPFSDKKHMSGNMGDGTFAHSGSLALRQLEAGFKRLGSGKGITVKLLNNGAIAMTGGQKSEGGHTTPELTWILYAEGMRRIEIVAEFPEAISVKDCAPGVHIHPRKNMQTIEESLWEVPGVSVIIYDEGCAAEKRRARNRGRLPEPDRVIINERVCEGCNDCAKAECLSVVQVETQFGRKRQIDQHSCNKDKSCAEGFCPSFVVVKGAVLAHRRGLARELAQRVIPEPVLPILTERSYDISLMGIGGTGVKTAEWILCMAAHICGFPVSGHSGNGLAQKGGLVSSDVRINSKHISSTCIPPGQADVMIGCDLVTSVGSQALALLKRGVSRVVINLHETPTAEFIYHPQKVFPKEKMLAALTEAVGANHVHGIEATFYVTELFGDAMPTNIFLVGFAYQLGLIPIKGDAIIEAIHLNGAGVEMNLDAFACGRYAAAFPQEFDGVGWRWKEAFEANRLPDSQEERIRFYAEELVAYQSRTYADQYLEIVNEAKMLDVRAGTTEGSPFTEAVSRNLFKLKAYKDEYEVARLYTDGAFERQLEREFSEYGTATHLLAPPMMGIKKREFGPWVRTLMRVVLAKLKFLRGTWLDPFGYSAHRKEERELIRQYEALVAEIGYGLNAKNRDDALALLSIPEEIRGYGHVKQASIEKAKQKAEALLKRFREKTT